MDKSIRKTKRGTSEGLKTYAEAGSTDRERRFSIAGLQLKESHFTLLGIKGFQISQTEIEYMNCDFSEDVQRDATPLRIVVQEIPQRYSFQYLGSIIIKDREIDEEL